MKKENSLSTFIKGFIVGFGIILPISSSGLAVVMGIYERILVVINNFFKCLSKEKKFIIFTFLGIIASVIASALLINFTYNKYRVGTLLFFVGLIIGGIPSLMEKTNKEYKPSNIIFTFIGIGLLLALFFLGTEGNATISTTPQGLIALFFAGLIAAGSMMIPGVSGSVVLLIIGFYKPMLEVVSNMLHFNNIGTNILIVGVFGVGMIVGIILVSKLMEFFLNKFQIKTFFTIIGFVCASVIILVFKEMVGFQTSTLELIIGTILFVVGFMLSYKYLKEE